MGTLLDLIRRFFGSRDQVAPQPGSTRPARPVASPPEPTEEPTADELPPPTRMEPRPEPIGSSPGGLSASVELAASVPVLVNPEPEPEVGPEPATEVNPEPIDVHPAAGPKPAMPLVPVGPDPDASRADLPPPIGGATAEIQGKPDVVVDVPPRIDPESPTAVLELEIDPAAPEVEVALTPEPVLVPEADLAAQIPPEAVAEGEPEPIAPEPEVEPEPVALVDEPAPTTDPVVVDPDPSPVDDEPFPPAGVEPPRPLGLAGDLIAPLLVLGAAPLSDPTDRADRGPVAARTRPAPATREAIAHRRATDIIYLGRGVSDTLNDRRGDHEALDRLGLPRLDTPAELADRLGIGVGRLRWLSFHAEVASRVHYVGFEIAKKGGGTRHLSAPHRSLAQAQRWILTEILARLPTEDAAHGFVTGRSIVTNAREHAGRAVVVNLDLANFFPSVGFRRVRAVFQQLGYSPALASILGLLCTEAPRRVITLEGETLHIATGPRGLPQGACTSPALSNQVAARFDRRLAGLAAKLGATYTRYADDLTFSGPANLDPRVGYLMHQVRAITLSEGFTVNESKTRVLRPNTAQVVTGLVVNDRPGVPRAEVRRLRAILHRARTEGLAAQNHANHPDFRSWLLGKISYVGMARPEVATRLLEQYRMLGPQQDEAKPATDGTRTSK